MPTPTAREVETAAVRHAQVEHDQFGRILRRDLACGRQTRRFAHLEPALAERTSQSSAQQIVIFDQQKERAEALVHPVAPDRSTGAAT
jgi:hypothetical protein